MATVLLIVEIISDNNFVEANWRFKVSVVELRGNIEDQEHTE